MKAGTFEKTQFICFKSFRIKSDHFRSKWIKLEYCIHNFNKSKMCLTWNRWNIIIFLFLLLQGGGHFWKKNLSKRLVCSSVWSNTLAATGFIQVCAWSSWDALQLSHHQSKEGFQFFYLPHRTERMDQQHSGPLFYYTVHTGRVAHWSRNKNSPQIFLWTNKP